MPSAIVNGGRWLAAVAVALLAVSGCGGDEDSATTTVPGDAVTTTSTAPAGPPYPVTT